MGPEADLAVREVRRWRSGTLANRDTGPCWARGRPPLPLLVEPGGERAHIANTMADIVTVIDIESAKVLRRISTGRQPDGMTWVP